MRPLALLPAVLLLGCASGTPKLCDKVECRAVLACPGEAPVTCTAARACEQQVCEGGGWTCGEVEPGSWAWAQAGVIPCDDGDACTSDDFCSGGSCRGTALSCDSPPAVACVDAVKLEVFEPVGTCQAGTCHYPRHEVSCPGGCTADQCVGDPCAGVSCTTPPDGCHATSGTCSQGLCSYALICDATQSCVDGACVCNAGLGDCTAAAGCETDLSSSAAHCGGCDNPCASGGSCVNGTCSNPPPPCYQLGEACAPNTCCAGLACTGGACCIPVQSACTSVSECCPGRACVASACCVILGDGCSQDPQCCNYPKHQCVGGKCCVLSGNGCSSGPQCCSGTCTSGKCA